MSSRDTQCIQTRVMKLLIITCIFLVLASICAYTSAISDTAFFAPETNYVAYYQTSGKHVLATQAVLTLFHRIYPWARICVYLDTLDTQIKHLLLETQDIVRITPGTADQSVSKTGMYFDTVHSAESYIQRLQNTARLMPRGWVFLLEDDVWVVRAVPEQDLRYDVSGACNAHYRPEYSLILTNQTASPVCYGGCGGHFVNSTKLLNISQARMHQLITRLLAVYSPIASDELLSAVILHDGGTIGPYPGFYETFKTGGTVKTEHQMKWLYGW